MQKKKVSFPRNTPDIINEILKKYGLEDSIDELVKKIFVEKGSSLIIRGSVILECAVKLANKEINREEGLILLNKELNIPFETAELIIKDIEDKLVSQTTLIENSTVETSEKIKDSLSFQQPPKSNNNFQLEQTLPNQEEFIEERGKEKKKKKTFFKSSFVKNKNDPYREKIE